MNGRSKRTCDLTSSIVPRGTSCHRSVELDFLLSDLILHGSHAAAGIVDDTGKIVREVKVASEPEALLAVLKNPAYHFKRIGLEAGPLSQ